MQKPSNLKLFAYGLGPWAKKVRKGPIVLLGLYLLMFQIPHMLAKALAMISCDAADQAYAKAPWIFSWEFTDHKMMIVGVILEALLLFIVGLIKIAYESILRMGQERLDQELYERLR